MADDQHRIERILDLDGGDDIVVGTDTRLRCLLNNGPGTGWSLAGELLLGAEVDRFALGELTGDGHVDVAVSMGDELRIYSAANGALALAQSFVEELPGTPLVLCGELTGDGLVDVVLFSDLGKQQLLRRTGAASFVMEPLLDGGPATDLADVDGDGLLDGVCCGGGGSTDLENDDPSFFQIALNDGDGRFGDSFDFKIGSLGAEHIAGAADMDADGDADLVAGRVVYYAHGPLRRRPHEPLGTGKVRQREIADVDVDGFPDLDAGIGQGLHNEGDAASRPGSRATSPRRARAASTARASPATSTATGTSTSSCAGPRRARCSACASS